MNPWALPQEAHEFLIAHVPSRATVLELGSGEGTARLVRAFDRVFTVEHDPAYVGKIEGAHYIHAPIVEGWYAPGQIVTALAAAGAQPDVVIVDGPPGSIGRAGLLCYPGIYKVAPLLVDDVHREAEGRLALELAEKRNQTVSVHALRDGRAFATIGFPWATHPETVRDLSSRGRK